VNPAPLSRLAGWCWADGSLRPDGGSLTTRRWGRVAAGFYDAANQLGLTVTSTPVGWRQVRLSVRGRLPRLASAAVPLAALASIIECEGRRDGLICDDQDPERLDEAEQLLTRALPPGGWRRTAWRGGGGALWIATIEALEVARAAPYVAVGRVPTRIAGG
jgi:hypothetical protein